MIGYFRTHFICKKLVDLCSPSDPNLDLAELCSWFCLNYHLSMARLRAAERCEAILEEVLKYWQLQPGEIVVVLARISSCLEFP